MMCYNNKRHDSVCADLDVVVELVWTMATFTFVNKTRVLALSRFIAHKKCT